MSHRFTINYLFDIFHEKKSEIAGISVLHFVLIVLHYILHFAVKFSCSDEQTSVLFVLYWLFLCHLFLCQGIEEMHTHIYQSEQSSFLLKELVNKT